MSVSPHSGIIDFGVFTPPDGSTNGIQGEVPAPLSTEVNYVLTATGWGQVDALPSQTGHNGQFLTTNGSVASWETINAGVTSVNGYVGAVTLTAADVGAANQSYVNILLTGY